MLRRAFDILRRRFRRGRYQRIRATLGAESLSGFILDLGGGPASFFAASFPRPEQVILLDVDYGMARQAKQRYPTLQVIVADGRGLPLAKGSVDATVCNSVIEHVSDPQALASEISRVSRRYFVQTPNGRFPMETHSFIGIPLYNAIPFPRLRRWVCQVFGANYDYLSSVHYLSERDLRSVFPTGTIAYERTLGWKKSFLVYHLPKGV